MPFQGHCYILVTLSISQHVNVLQQCAVGKKKMITKNEFTVFDQNIILQMFNQIHIVSRHRSKMYRLFMIQKFLAKEEGKTSTEWKNGLLGHIRTKSVLKCG